ncbi:MAG: efflux RND transporter permease subunit [Spirochaetes bacterium]|nr:efflux RND transporter permease subunit [Spirochaetota bacterium]
MKQPITAFIVIGIVMLIGLVTNSGVLLVDYTNQLVRKGWNTRDACLEAGVVRFRQIMMTALTAMLRFSAMAFAPGSSSALRRLLPLWRSADLVICLFLYLCCTRCFSAKRRG